MAEMQPSSIVAGDANGAVDLLDDSDHSRMLADFEEALDTLGPDDFVRESPGLVMADLGELAVLGGQSTRAAKSAAAARAAAAAAAAPTSPPGMGGAVRTPRVRPPRFSVLQAERRLSMASAASEADVDGVLLQLEAEAAANDLYPATYAPLPSHLSGADAVGEDEARKQLFNDMLGLSDGAASLTDTTSATPPGNEEAAAESVFGWQPLNDLSAVILRGRPGDPASSALRTPVALLSEEEQARRTNRSYLPSLSAHREQTPEATGAAEADLVDDNQGDQGASVKSDSSEDRPIEVTIMRHGTRLDGAKDWDTISATEWRDKGTRPHDTPIHADGVVHLSLTKLRERRKVDRIISSPFRRCLQTAAVAARSLGVATVKVDSRLRESKIAVERCYRDAKVPLPDSPSVLASDEAAVIIGGDRELIWDREADFATSRAVGEDFELRVAGVIRDAIKEDPTRSRILLITHGDLINGFSPLLFEGGDVGRFTAEVAGWVTYALDARALSRPSAAAVLDRHQVEDLGAEVQDADEGAGDQQESTETSPPAAGADELSVLVARLNDVGEMADRVLNSSTTSVSPSGGGRYSTVMPPTTPGGNNNDDDDDLSDWANVSEAESGPAAPPSSGRRTWSKKRTSRFNQASPSGTSSSSSPNKPTSDVLSPSRGPAAQVHCGRRKLVPKPLEVSSLDPIEASPLPSPVMNTGASETLYGSLNLDETLYKNLPEGSGDGPVIVAKQQALSDAAPQCSVGSVVDIPVEIRNLSSHFVKCEFSISEAVFGGFQPPAAMAMLPALSSKVVVCKFAPSRDGNHTGTLLVEPRAMDQSGETKGPPGRAAEASLVANAMAGDKAPALRVYPECIDLEAVPVWRTSAVPVQVACDQDGARVLIEVRGGLLGADSDSSLFLATTRPRHDSIAEAASIEIQLSSTEPSIVWVCIHPNRDADQEGRIDGILTARLLDDENSECTASISGVLGRVHLEIQRSNELVQFHTSPGKPQTRMLPIRNVGTVAMTARVSIVGSHDMSGHAAFTVSPEELLLGVGERSTISVTYSPDNQPHGGASATLDSATLCIIDDEAREVHRLEVAGHIDSIANEADGADQALSLLCNLSNVIWPGIPATAPTVLQIRNNATNGEAVTLNITVEDGESGFSIDTGVADETHEVTHGEILDVPVRLRQSGRAALLTQTHLVVSAAQHLEGAEPITSAFKVPMIGFVGGSRVEVVSARIGTTPLSLSKSRVRLGTFEVDRVYQLVLSLKNRGDRAAAIWTTVTNEKSASLGQSLASVSPPTMAIRAGSTRTVRIRFRPNHDMLSALAARSRGVDGSFRRGVVGVINFSVADEASRLCVFKTIMESGFDSSAIPVDLVPFCRYFDGEELVRPVVRGQKPAAPTAENVTAAVDLFRSCISQIALDIAGTAPVDDVHVVPFRAAPTQATSNQNHLTPPSARASEQEPSPARSDGTVVLDSSQSETVLTPSSTAVQLYGIDAERVMLRNVTPSTRVCFEAMSLNHDIDVAPSAGTVRPGKHMFLSIRATPQCEPYASSRVYVMYTHEGQRHQITIDVDTEPVALSGQAVTHRAPRPAAVMVSPPKVKLEARIKSTVINVGITCAGERASESMPLRSLSDHTMTWVLSPSGSATVSQSTGRFKTGSVEPQVVAETPFRFRRQSGTILARETVELTADFCPTAHGDFVHVWDLRLMSPLCEDDMLRTQLTLKGTALGPGQRSLIGTLIQRHEGHAAPRNAVSRIRSSGASSGRGEPTGKGHGSSPRHKDAASTRDRVTVDLKVLPFPATPVGRREIRHIRVCNRAHREVSVHFAISDGGSAFFLAHSGVTLRPRSFIRLPVLFDPPVGGKHAGTLVTSVDQGSKLVSVLTGKTTVRPWPQ